MVDTIIFDIGSVLVDWNYRTFLDKMFKSEDARNAVRKCLFENPMYAEFDRGVLEEEEVLRKCISLEPKYEKEIRFAFKHIGKCVVQRDFVKSWILDLKSRGYRVIYLSNYSHNCLKQNKKQLDFLSLMDGGVFSCYVKMAKPDLRIYKLMIDKFNLIPENCVFIDDKNDNIVAGEKCGIEGILYMNYEQAVESLEQTLRNKNGG